VIAEKVMRVLDLELDLFLDDVAYHRPSSRECERLPDGEYTPWAAAAVRTVLEDHYGLDRARPIPGRLVTHHFEAFLFWQELVRCGALDIPFDVVHVDAHADLGSGDAGYVYLMT
jgi:hypothetical protein